MIEIEKSMVTSVYEAETTTFDELVKLTNLDPKNDFKYAQLSGVDFRHSNLLDFDFSYADLRNASWEGCEFFPTRMKFAMLGQASDPVAGRDYDRIVRVAIGSQKWADRFHAFALIVENFGATELTLELLSKIVNGDRSTYMRLCSVLFYIGETIQNPEYKGVCESMANYGNARVNIFRMQKVRRFLREASKYLDARNPWMVMGDTPGRPDIRQLNSILSSREEWDRIGR